MIGRSAAMALPDLLLCALDARDAGFCALEVPQELARVAIQALLDALREEEDVYCMTSFVNAIQVDYHHCHDRF
jgi:hypothetical protein